MSYNIPLQKQLNFKNLMSIDVFISYVNRMIPEIFRKRDFKHEHLQRTVSVECDIYIQV